MFKLFFVGLWARIVALSRKIAGSQAAQDVLVEVEKDAVEEVKRDVHLPAWLIGVVLVGSLLNGCTWFESLPPSTIQADVAVGLSVALQGVAMADPTKADAIRKDAKVIAGIINQDILPSFFAGAKAGTLVNASVNTSLMLLNSKIVGTPNGPMIVSEIKLALTLFSATLSSANSPAASMSPQAQTDAVAFFSGVSQAISAFTQDPTLMPPVDPAAVK